MEIPTGESERHGHGEEEGEASKVTIRFVLEGSEKHLSCSYNLGHTVEAMREDIASSWGIPLQSTTISFDGETLSGATTVGQLAVSPGQLVELQVQQSTPTAVEGEPPANYPPNTTTTHSTHGSHRMPDVFTVQVTAGRETKEVLVKVERMKGSKLFLGGYKHKVTGVQYHHASTQTVPKKKNTGIETFQRETQTVVTRNMRQQVTVDAGTQMNKAGCFVNDQTDRVVSAGVYETAEQRRQKILEKVILLQTHWRRWLAERYVAAFRREKQEREEWERREAVRRQKEREAHVKQEFERRMNPHTKEDFELLYHALEMWRQDELHRINETTAGPERKAALCALLEQEAQLIASIGRHKITAGQENKEEATKRFLDTMAAPKQWTAYDGKTTAMDTPFTLRAQQLRDIYNSVILQSLSRDERLDVLLTLKCTVKEHDCKLTREIVELVDREADLLVRGMKEATLQGLRKRIATLFFQYCKTPLFNAEAAKHIKVPQDASALRSNVYYCRSCCQYLPSTDFELSTNSRVVGHCRSCRELDNQARAREDYTLYRAMLRAVRKSEEGYKDDSHIVFLMQEPDLCYLVENIWGGQSALSAVQHLFELVMVRWDRREQWSPWNCILLTKDEAKAHCRLDNVQEAYGPQFVRKVHHRHVLARSYFSHIPGMAEQMRSKVEELPLPRPLERVVTPRTRQDNPAAIQQAAVQVEAS